MHFRDMPYARVVYEEVEKQYQALFQKLKEVSCEEDCRLILKEHSRLQDDMTSISLCMVHHDMDLNDAFYAEEQNYYDEIGPKITDLENEFGRLLTVSPYSTCFEKLMGSFSFSIIRIGLEGYDSCLISLEQEENALTGQYSRLTANGKADYNGRMVSRSSLTAEAESPDREVRRSVSEALARSWEAQHEELESIFDRLVQNRDAQARMLGFENYVSLGYLRMSRIGYTPDDVRCFREQVKKYIVPVGAKLYDQRRKRIGLEHMYGYDSSVFFQKGNPVPLGDTRFCLEMTREMFTRLSPETEEFIHFLLDNGLYDVEAREGKFTGAYCAQFDAYRCPFILADFDGTSENAYVMSHEGGHAFYFYLKRNEEIRERGCYTSEMAETHAMSMEFFLAPYMELFFGDRADDYRKMHLENAVMRIIYQCQQDEFQEIIYRNPELTPMQRNEVWEKLESEYFPFREYTEEERRRIGRRWQRIPHTYLWPFYAIDYGLAQVCALEYCQWMNEDFDAAWKSYLTFCEKSGNMNFPEAVKAAGLGSPFEEGSLEKLMIWLDKQL
ncbi:MAG: M3 family oligoendopeptidase [Lachnospiraceae bacterium]